MDGHVDKLAVARVNLLMAVEVCQFQVGIGVLAAPGPLCSAFESGPATALEFGPF